MVHGLRHAPTTRSSGRLTAHTLSRRGRSDSVGSEMAAVTLGRRPLHAVAG
jgi:hypothetical protein